MSLDPGIPRETPAGREAPRRRPWWFLAGFLAGAAVALGVVRVRPIGNPEIATPAPVFQNVVPAVTNADEGAEPATDDLDDEGLRARWVALQLAFVKVAEPLTDALDRVEKLRADSPMLQAQAREAEAGYLTAREARERAESDYTELLEDKARGVEGQPAKRQVSEVDLIARQSKYRLDAMRRDRQKAVDSLVAKGMKPAEADALAGNLYNLRIKNEEHRLEQLQPILDRAKSEQDRDERFGQQKRLTLLHAEIEARRADELACQAIWEKAKADQRALESRMGETGLSLDERRQLDQLLEVVRKTGSRPPGDGDPVEFRAFLDRFAARLAEVTPARGKPSGNNVSSRFNRLVNRLLRVHDTPIPPGGRND